MLRSDSWKRNIKGVILRRITVVPSVYKEDRGFRGGHHPSRTEFGRNVPWLSFCGFAQWASLGRSFGNLSFAINPENWFSKVMTKEM